MEKEIELPAWFELIQTDRDYYIDAYKKQLNGVNKFNYKVLLSSLFAGNFYLLYKKFGLELFIIYTFLFSFIGMVIWGIMLDPLLDFFSIPNDDEVFTNNPYLGHIIIGYIAVLYTSLYLFFSKQ